MNFGIATAANSSVEKNVNYAAEPQRIGQVERALQELEQTASFLEKHAEQLFNRLSTVVAPVPAQQQGGEGKVGAGVPALCSVAERIESQIARFRRVVNALEVATGLIEL